MKNLGTKALVGLLQLLLTVGVALFVPAWSLDFWEAWLYLLFFGLSAGIITLYLWQKDPTLLERRVKAGPGAEKGTTQKIIQTCASLLFLALMLIPGFDHRFGWSEVPWPLVILGDLLVVLGFLMIFFVFKENTYTAATIQIAEGQTVTSTGPYAIVRHPMYSGAMLLLLGTPLALGSYWALLTFPFLVAVIIWRLLDEEKFLAQSLPGYKAYCQNVSYHLLPFIW